MKAMRQFTKEHKLKIANALRGRKLSDEMKRKISKGTKKGMARPEVKAKLKASGGNGNGFKKGHPFYGDLSKPNYYKTGKNNPNWKGDDVKYDAVHAWIRKYKGKPTYCEDIDCEGRFKKYHWANIDHQYRRNLDDYISLCAFCHKKYDKLNN